MTTAATTVAAVVVAAVVVVAVVIAAAVAVAVVVIVVVVVVVVVSGHWLWQITANMADKKSYWQESLCKQMVSWLHQQQQQRPQL